MPVLFSFSGDQCGESFGQRLANAVEKSFALGYSRLLICGTDTPDLTEAHFLEAAERLQTHSVVLGPSPDGGVYLIGLRRESFRKEAFQSLPWLSALVLRSLTAWAKEQALPLCLLSTLTDVDELPVAVDVLPGGKKNWFAVVLHQLFGRLQPPKHPSLPVDRLPVRGLFSACFRGPPPAVA